MHFKLFLIFFFGFTCNSLFVANSVAMQRLVNDEQAHKFSLCGVCNKPLNFEDTLISVCQHAIHKQCFDKDDASRYQFDESTTCPVCGQILVQRTLDDNELKKQILTKTISAGYRISPSHSRDIRTYAIHMGFAGLVKYFRPSSYYSSDFNLVFGFTNSFRPFVIWSHLQKAITLAEESEAPILAKRIGAYRKRFIVGLTLVSISPLITQRVAQLMCDTYHVPDTKAAFVTTSAAIVGSIICTKALKYWATNPDNIPRIPFKPSV